MIQKWLNWLKDNVNIIKDIFTAIREITIVVVLLIYQMEKTIGGNAATNR